MASWRCRLPDLSRGMRKFITRANLVADSTSFAPSTLPLDTGRPRLLILGTGWAAARLLRDIDPKLYDVTVISARNHMVFTPLLASATVGTLEARSVALHVTAIQRALHLPQNGFVQVCVISYRIRDWMHRCRRSCLQLCPPLLPWCAPFVQQAEATAVLPERRLVEARSADGLRFYAPYDKLAICTGSQARVPASSLMLPLFQYFMTITPPPLLTWCVWCRCCTAQGSTFGIPGVEEHAHFLRDVRHAEAIRSKLIENIALAGVPGAQTPHTTEFTDKASLCYIDGR